MMKEKKLTRTETDYFCVFTPVRQDKMRPLERVYPINFGLDN